MAEARHKLNPGEIQQARARVAETVVARLLASMRDDGQRCLDLWGRDA